MYSRSTIVSAALCLALVFAAPSPTRAEEEFNKHAIEIFLGAASKFAEAETNTEFGVGLGYEFRFVRWLGVGLVGEYVNGVDRDGTLLFPVFAHPWRGLRLELAPGIEFADGSNEFAFRFGAAYEIELWRHFSISPELNADLVDGETPLVYGASLGWGF